MCEKETVTKIMKVCMFDADAPAVRIRAKSSGGMDKPRDSHAARFGYNIKFVGSDFF